MGNLEGDAGIETGRRKGIKTPFVPLMVIPKWTLLKIEIKYYKEGCGSEGRAAPLIESPLQTSKTRLDVMTRLERAG